MFKPDLYRSFATGFVLGTLLLVGTMVARSDGPGRVIPAAQAATALPDRTR